jgi:hypothetical protein
MIQFNSDLKELEKFVLEHGVVNNWNYSENLLIKNILVQTNSPKTYEVVMIRFYKATGNYYYINQLGEEMPLKYVKQWCAITV